MNKQKVSNLLGLAQRAGKIISGEEMVVKAIQDRKVKLVFLAHDAGPNLTKKIQDKSHYYQVEVITVFSTLELSIAVREIKKGFGCDRCWIYKENEVSYGIEEEDSDLSKKRLYEIAKELGKKVRKL